MSRAEMINSSESEPNDFVVVLITAPQGRGNELGRALVERKLCACINVVRGIHSIYWWQGAVEEGDEELLICKTVLSRLEELKKVVKEIHPYEVPEVIALRIVDGLRAYLDWVRESVSS